MASITSWAKQLLIDRDKQVFDCIRRFMIKTNGASPKIRDIVAMINDVQKKDGRNHRGKSASESMVHKSTTRLEDMGLITKRREVAGRKTVASSIRIAASTFKIHISKEDYTGVIERHHGQRDPESNKRNTAKE